MIDSASAETDVDGGVDWDIFNINEGLWAHCLCCFVV